MSSNDFNAASFLLRWVFALLLVLGTYNPTDYCYTHWVITGIDDFGPEMALVGIALIIGWIIFLRATFLALGVIGIGLFAAFFACVIWLLIDHGLLSLESTGVITWIIMVLISLVLATGMSWGHIRRRLSGQLTVDDVGD